MRKYPFRLRRLLLAIASFQARAKYLPGTRRAALLNKPFTGMAIVGNVKRLKTQLMDRGKGKIGRITPRYLPLKPPILPLPSTLSWGKTKRCSPPSLPFRSSLIPNIRRPNPRERKEMKPALRVPLGRMDETFPLKKIGSPMMDKLNIKPTVEKEISFSPPRFPSSSQAKEDIFYAFLLSLKRNMGG